MEAIYSNKNIKNRAMRGAGEESSSDDVVYSEVHIIDSNQRRAPAAAKEQVIYSTLAFSNPAADLSTSHLPGPNDPGDPSLEGRLKVTTAQVKERRLLVSLCVLLFAVALISAVLYGFEKLSHKDDKQMNHIREMKSTIDQLQAGKENLTRELEKSQNRTKQFQEEKNNLTSDLQKMNSSIEQLQAGKENLSRELQITQDTLNQTEKNYQREKDKLQNKLDESQSRTKQLQEEKNYLTSDLQKKKSRIEQLQAEKGNLIRELKTLKGEGVQCDEGWKFFSGKCYFFSTDTEYWTGSRDACVAMGGDLVIINSPEEKEFLAKSKVGPIEKYWIGLTDAVTEKDWRWLDGTKLSDEPKYWTGNEPDNWNGTNQEYSEGEDCGVMEIGSGGGCFLDVFCNGGDKRNHICEVNAAA